MPQNVDPQHEGFEEELGAVLRRTGDGFAVDDRRELVAGGLQRGRRRLVRRRLAVTGGALALAAIGIGGVYGGSLLSPVGGSEQVSVAGPRPTADPAGPEEGKPGLAEIPVEELATVLKANTPAGTWEIDNLGGTGQSVAGVYDDGKGKAGVTVGLFRAGGTAESGAGQVTCPSMADVPHDDCTSERLPNGARLMVFQGYEYPDRREETKHWRAVLLTKDGFLVDASAYNAAAEKGAEVSRENPPFTPAQMKALVTADAWSPLLKRLVANPSKKPGDTKLPPAPSGTAVQATLRSLLPESLTIHGKNAGDGHAHLVVDDGKGLSYVGVDVQPSAKKYAGALFGGADVVTLPDGRKVKATKQPGEKGGAGVVWWSVDTITPEGFRVVVSAFNTGAQHEDATRAEPALTMEQLKAIALSPTWRKLPLK
ncbi:hypothetical protein AB0M38_19345 [Streptomyces sp. NPDC051742]|uniref:hypothetical protein n=1 Tax=unclassified Streptomyces TaxID=2593676 RepID=UPI00343D0C35